MIGKGKSIAHTANAIGYARNKLQAEEIDRHLVAGQSPREMAKEFQVFQDLNTRCEKNTFSFVISPHPDDSRKLSNPDYRKLVKDFLKAHGLEKNQYVAYLHKDKAHAHMHIYCNRINEFGIAKKDSYIGKESQKIAQNMAIERRFITAKEIQRENIKKTVLSQNKGIKTIKQTHEQVMAKKPKNVQQYARFMHSYGIPTTPKFANSGKCVGIKFKVKGESIKGSTVGKGFTGSSIEKTIAQALTKETKIPNIPKPRINNDRGLTL